MRISDWSSDVCSSDLAAGFVDDVRRIAGLPELIVIGDVGRDGRDARHLAVLEDIAADMFGSQRTEAPEMYRNLVADLADEPFIMLERHPVARPPAMIAMPRRIERNHPIADPQRAFGATRLLDALGGAIGRPAAPVGPIRSEERRVGTEGV